MDDADGMGTVTYQWRQDGVNISGQTSNELLLTEAMVGKTITVIASYTDGQGTPESLTSAATTAVVNVNDAPTGGVTISGTATQGETLTAHNTLADLDGLEFAARIDIEKDGRGEDRNTIKAAIEPDHKDYALVMGVMPKGGMGNAGGGQSGAPAAVAAPSYTPPAATARPATSTVPSGKPAWAQ